MEQRLYEALQSNPIIAAVRDDEGLEACLQADVQTVFVLYGDICGIAGIVRREKPDVIHGHCSVPMLMSMTMKDASSPLNMTTILL